MKENILKYMNKIFVLAISIIVFASCNKDLPDPVPITPPQGTGTQTIPILPVESANRVPSEFNTYLL